MGLVYHTRHNLSVQGRVAGDVALIWTRYDWLAVVHRRLSACPRSSSPCPRLPNGSVSPGHLRLLARQRSFKPSKSATTGSPPQRQSWPIRRKVTSQAPNPNGSRARTPGGIESSPSSDMTGRLSALHYRERLISKRPLASRQFEVSQRHLDVIVGSTLRFANAPILGLNALARIGTSMRLSSRLTVAH
jgi:hypothetical protein